MNSSTTSTPRLHRPISVPDLDGGSFVARGGDGTVIECSLLAPLLKGRVTAPGRS